MGLVSPEMAEKIARLGFPAGGYRICRFSYRSHKATLEQIIEWTQHGRPLCKLCAGRTELLTPAEFKRMKPYE
jgi:hypothetical protein